MQLLNNLTNKIKNGTYFNLLLLGVTPALIILICLIAISIISFNSAKEQVQLNAETTMTFLSDSNQEKINFAIESTALFAQEENLTKYLHNPAAPPTQEVILAASKGITDYMQIFDFVDNVFLYNQTSDVIITANGTYSIKDYFTLQYSYLDYSDKYWNNILFWDDSNYRILAPTIANSVSGSITALPIIIRNINNDRTNIYIVININLDKFLSSSIPTHTASSELYILNCISQKTFPLHKKGGEYTEISPELYSELLKGSNRSFNFEIDKKKYFVVSHSNVIGLNGFIYYRIFPFNELLASQQILYTIIVLLVSLFTLIAIFILRKRINEIYSPIKTLAQKLSINTKAFKLTDISNSTEALINQNISLYSMLPFAQEKYLMNFLNSTEYNFDKETQNIILQNLPFKNPLFVYIIIQTSPTEQMFREFSTEEHYNIQQGLYNLIKNAYSSNFNAFFLSSELNSLHIILNPEDASQKEDISNIWEQILKLLKNDREYIKLYYGESDVHKDLEGLKLAHEQAFKNLAFVPDSTTLSKHSSIPKSLITRADESKLYNLLIAHQTEDAKNLLHLYKNRLTYYDGQTKKNFYSKVLSVIIKVLQTKKISYSEELRNDYEFIADILQNDTDNIYSVVIELMEKINIYSEKKDTKNIIPYISENYSNKGLSLEYIASVFKTNPSYVSTFVKNNLNIGFHEFLTNIRVTEAKSLLTKTKKPISEICSEVGFSSRTTFFRSFKQETGMTPSEFRNRYSIS